MISLFIFFCISLASYAHEVTYVNDQFDPPLTNSWNHLHWTNSYSGTIYHQEGEGGGTPAPWIDKFVNDSFGAETLWVNSDEYGDDTTFNNCVFYGTNISNLMADVDISHCSGDLSIHVRNIDARYSVFENSYLNANSIDVSHASLIGSTLIGGATFKDTYVREADLNLVWAEGSVRGTPNYLSPTMKIKNGNLIGMSVQNDGANFSYCDLTDVQFNDSSSFVGANFTGCIISNLASGDFSSANFGGAVISNFGSGASFPAISNASFIAATLEGAAYTNLTNAAAILQFTHVGGSGLDPTTNFYDYYEAATNIYESLVDYTNQLKVVSNQVITLEDQHTSLTNSIENTAINWDVIIDNLDAELLFLEGDLGALSNKVIILSNKVISTIHELEPNLEVLENSNGIITLNMEMRSSGDLQSWQPMYNKEITIVPTNDVRFYRLQSEPVKGQ